MGEPAVLMLEDGRTFQGEQYGARGTALGEVVFNTSMTGYQEVLTDPSYTGQLVTMTYPLIGNYGANPEDQESARPQVAGFVIHEAPPVFSNWRARESLDAYLQRHGVVSICGVTRATRSSPSMLGAARARSTSDAGSSVPMHPFCEPLSRVRRVSRRVSTPVIATIPCFAR